MPLINTKYKSPGIFKNAHVSSIYAATLRKVSFSFGRKDRIELSDGDFLDLERSFYSAENTLPFPTYKGDWRVRRGRVIK